MTKFAQTSHIKRPFSNITQKDPITTVKNVNYT